MSEQNKQETVELNRKQIRKMASVLRCALGIQEGIELVYMIGEGIEINNSQAIESWIYKQLTLLSQTESESLFDRLKMRLSQTLTIEELH